MFFLRYKADIGDIHTVLSKYKKINICCINHNYKYLRLQMIMIMYDNTRRAAYDVGYVEALQY